MKTYRVTLYAVEDGREYTWQIEAGPEATRGAVANFAVAQHLESGREPVQLPSVADVKEIKS